MSLLIHNQELGEINMAEIKDISKIDRPREKFINEGPELLSNADLLAIVLGSGIEGKNAQQLSRQILTKFGDNFLNITVDDLQKFDGIGQVKALRIVSAICLIKRLFNDQNIQIVKNISQVVQKRGFSVTDFVIVSTEGHYSFLEELNKQSIGSDCVMSDAQQTLFDLLEIKNPLYKCCFKSPQSENGYFQIKSRRYLGNKHKLLGFICDIISEKCDSVNSFCDIFAGTGVVGEKINTSKIRIISNDFLSANYVCLQTFLGVDYDIRQNLVSKIKYLNSLPANVENYFSEHFGGSYFSWDNARKIGKIREEIEKIATITEEKNVLLCSLLYAVDKVANTVGHYDAFRKKLDMLQPIKLLVPDIKYSHNTNNEIYRKDANMLARNIFCDVLYIDPPYNSRQYSDAYHLLENLVEWKKPAVHGIGKKMDRSHIKSEYCMTSATRSFEDLVKNANCKHILFSYNDSGETKDGRSNSRMRDDEIFQILSEKGNVEIFEKSYKEFTTGKSRRKHNSERIFYCKVK